MNRFVTFEGGEGAGKSTQIALVAARLRDQGYDVVTTREPGGSPLAERLRRFILSPTRPALPADVEAMLFAAARSDHLSKTVNPALGRGAIVLCDRFADSTMAYQGLAAGEDHLRQLYAESVADDGPSLTFVFDVSPDVGLARAAARRGADAADRFEGEGIDYHRALAARFRAIAAAEPDRCVVVDCSPTRSREDIRDFIVAGLASRLCLDGLDVRSPPVTPPC